MGGGLSATSQVSVNTTQSATTGITVATTITNSSGGNAHAIVQPTITINYIIKVMPNTTGAGGVVVPGGHVRRHHVRGEHHLRWADYLGDWDD